MDWLTVFIDFPATEFDVGTQFWCAASGYALSPLRGDHGEFATLLPPGGQAYLRVQKLGTGVTRLHLDLHSAQPRVLAAEAVGLGAHVIDDSAKSHVVLRSPAGVVFCAVAPVQPGVPAPATWQAGQRSRLDQLCLDVPQAVYAEEVAFWQNLLGGRWKVRGSDPLATRMADGWALELRLQPSQLANEPSGHLHLVTDDRAAEVARLASLGAVKRIDRSSWTLLEAVGGMALCVVDDVDDGECRR